MLCAEDGAWQGGGEGWAGQRRRARLADTPVNTDTRRSLDRTSNTVCRRRANVAVLQCGNCAEMLIVGDVLGDVV